MLKKTIVAFILVGAAGGQIPAAGQDSRFELTGRYWSTDLGGEIEVVDAGLGTTIALQDDLGIDGDELPELRLIVRPSRNTSLRFSWLQAEFEGDEILSRTVEFNGEIFDLSTRILSTLNFDYGRAGFAWQFLASDDGRFRLGPLVEIKAFRGDASLTAPDLFGISASEEFEGAFGSAGLAFDAELGDRARIFAEGTVLVAADDADATDFEAGVHIFLTDAIALTGGYRSFDVEATDDDDRYDFQIDGAFVGLTLSF